MVLGGGLAGISTTRHLLKHGYKVTLIEKRPYLGGKAFSFQDPETKDEVDNGQHIFMGCCTQYLDLLKTIGTYNKAFLQSKLEIEIELYGQRSHLSSTPFLGPLHMLPSLIKYKHMNLSDKLLTVYAMILAKFTNRSKNIKSLDNQTFYQWLKKRHQTERAIKNLWNLIILPTLNDDVKQVSANMGLMVIQEGFLKKYKDATIGYSTVGLNSLTGEPAKQYIQNNGGCLLMGKSAKSILMTDERINAIKLSDNSLITADAYVSALPFNELLKLLPVQLSKIPFFSKTNKLNSSPILGIHIWYDRPVMEGELMTFIDSPIQWVFNKTIIQNHNLYSSQYICISVSGAWEYINESKETLLDIFSTEMRRLFPKAQTANIEKFLVVKQPEATLRCNLGVTKLRPSQKTPIPNMFLAGEWTDTGWPSTMESAVRSGTLAANFVIESI